jgi:glycosyltransferase involved in cell wall biosynthesis
MNTKYKNGGLALLIPAYNAAKYLPRLFASVQSQTQGFDEIWVYDDCSVDNTGEIAREFGANVVRGDVNRGCSHGKNSLALQTNCQWIHFHDADDALFPEFVARAHHWMRQDDYDVVLFPYEEREEGTGAVIAIRHFDPDDVKLDPVSYSIREQINPFCGLYRREAFLHAGGYDTDPSVLYNEDVAMHCRLAQAGLKFTADDQVLIINNRRLDSMSSSNQSKCLAAHYQVMKKASEVVGDKYFSDIARRLWVVAGGSAAYLDWKTADGAARLATKLAGRTTSPAGLLFNSLCWISPILAVRLREIMIRIFKPRYREGYPAWRLRMKAITKGAADRA